MSALKQHTTFALVCFAAIATAGCKDRKKPIVDARAEHADTLADVAAQALFLKGRGSVGALRVGHLTRRRIAKATLSASVAKRGELISIDQELDEPRYRVRSALYHVHVMCDAEPSSDLDEKELDVCAEAVGSIESELESIHKAAMEEGIGDAFPGTLNGWSTEASKARASALGAAVKAVDESKVAAKWAEANATVEELDAACKEFIDKEKNSTSDASAGADQELESLVREVRARDISRCVVLLNYRLTEKIFSGCLEKNDARCFHERSCSFVTSLRDSLEPKISFRERIPDLDAIPAAMLPRVKQFVTACRPYMR